MGLSSNHLTVRSVTLALLLLIAPLHGVAGADSRTVDPLALLDIEPEELVFTETTAWRVESLGPPLVMKAQARPSLAPDRLYLPIGGIEVFGYHATVTGGALVLLVDGIERQRLGPGSHVKDLALREWDSEMVWEFVPSKATDAVQLVLDGARPLLAPALGYFSTTLWSGCGEPPTLWFTIRFAAPIVAGQVALSIDEEAVKVRTYTSISGNMWTTHVNVEAPRLPDGTPSKVRALYEDATGKAWDLIGGERTVWHDSMTNYIGAGPDGWVYDLTPTVGVSSHCLAEDLSNVRFWLDGVERTSELQPCATGAQWTFPEALAFNETHAWRFEVTLLDGSVVTRTGVVREGFDVMEFDVPSLALVWTEGFAGVGSDGYGKAALMNAADPEGLPPVYADLREPLGDGTAPPLALGGAHLRAVYAPLGIDCHARVVSCSPYNGEAPGFRGEPLRAADLTITLPSGAVTVLPGAGQFAAASRMTELGRGTQEFVEMEANMTRSLVELGLRLVHSYAEWAPGWAAYQLEWPQAWAEYYLPK